MQVKKIKRNLNDTMGPEFFLNFYTSTNPKDTFLYLILSKIEIKENGLSWNNAWTSLYMDGTAKFDLPTWGGPFNPYNVTQTHLIFIKL